jgi:hypothetical protein
MGDVLTTTTMTGAAAFHNEYKMGASIGGVKVKSCTK